MNIYLYFFFEIITIQHKKVLPKSKLFTCFPKIWKTLVNNTLAIVLMTYVVLLRIVKRFTGYVSQRCTKLQRAI